MLKWVSDRSEWSIDLSDRPSVRPSVRPAVQYIHKNVHKLTSPKHHQSCQRPVHLPSIVPPPASVQTDQLRQTSIDYKVTPLWLTSLQLAELLAYNLNTATRVHGRSLLAVYDRSQTTDNVKRLPRNGNHYQPGILLLWLVTCVMTSYLWYDELSVLWRVTCVVTSYLCYDKLPVLWRVTCVMTSYLCYNSCLCYDELSVLW